MYKLVILDYDGTMVGRSGIATDPVKTAIKDAVKKGVKISISTGRSFYTLKNIIRELGLDLPHVFLAGSLLYNPIKDLILIEDVIKPELVIEANDFALKNNLYLEAATFNKLYYNLEIPEITVKRTSMISESDGLTDLSELAKKRKILVMRFIVTSDKDKKLVREFQEIVSDRLSFHVGHTFNEPNVDVWNMTDIGVSKVSALRHLCQYLKIHPSETMAIGDSPIDLPLLENVGFGVAMGNANKEVKKKAKWVAPGVEEDGVAAAFEKFILQPHSDVSSE